MALLSVQKLIAAAGRPAAALPVQTHRSFPIPVHAPEGQRIVFLFCPSSISMEEGLRLLPPEYVAELDPATGRLLRMRAVTPADFGRSDPADEFLGCYDMLPGGRTPEQYHELHRNLLAAYDVMLPVFAAKPRRVSPQERQAARAFRTLFPQVTEQPLQPYYQVLGRDFFAWLEETAR